MEKSKLKVIVKDIQSDQTLFECSLDESDKAFQFAAEMEELGLEVKVVSPSLTETLSNSLGLTKEQEEAYKTSLEEEMENHEGSCCFKDEDDKIIH